jgi:RNA polymerase sigma-70 factor (ECF subfamily)
MESLSDNAALPAIDSLYAEVAATYAASLERLAQAYEIDRERQRDLLQEIHLALWRSFETFDGRCSLRTWVYRVAHNIGATHVLRARRNRASRHFTLEQIEALPGDTDMETRVDKQLTRERMLGLIQQMAPADRQLMLLYLDGLDGATIAEVTGLSVSNANTRIHRIKSTLTRLFSARAKP